MLPHLTHVLVMCLLMSSAVNIATAGGSNHSSVSACYAPDREALLSFARAAGLFYSPYINSSWHGDDCCSWDGIICSNATSAGGRQRRITGIFVQDFALHAISTSLCNLSALTAFALRFARVETNISIPECVGTHLTLLNSFTLWFDELMMINIPASFSRLSSLQSLDLLDMRIDSRSLHHIISLPSLVQLSLWSCSLVPSSLALFTIPHTLSNLTSLTLSECSLSGPLPPFTNMPLLQELILAGNSLNSTLEDFMLHSNISALRKLNLVSNNLSGQLLPHHFKNLTELSLGGNQFSGPFPDFINSPLMELIDLSHNNFSGPVINSPLMRFIDLSPLIYSIDLSYNHFSGPFPDLVNSPLMETIDLSYNNFSGLFPNLINCPLMYSIDLSYNHFSCVLPESWQHLSSLRQLVLSGNTIEASTVVPSRRLPEWLFRLPSLQQLHLASTGLQPGDCECHGMLSLLNHTLEELDVSENNLTGPNVLNCFALFNFSSIEYVGLSSNPLAFDLSSASVSASMLTFPLLGIDMHNCSLFGSIPIQLLSLFGGFLDLSFNGLTGIHGKIHNQSLFCSQHTQEISLSHNLISADISFLVSTFDCGNIQPDALNTFSGSTLDVSYNNLTGGVPASASTSTLLSIFNRVLLNHNLITGSISPDLVGGAVQYSNLRTLKLNNNRLVGSIPTSILHITTLELLDLSYNQLEGNFTTLYSSIEQRTQLRVLLLAHNKIHGSIPSSFGALTPDLQVIDLSNNKLSQGIPTNLHLPTFMRASPSPNDPADRLYEEVHIAVKGVLATYEYELVALTSLDLSYNDLIGAIPPQLGDFIGLRYLNLSGNMLSGHIPASLHRLHLLESMDLSYNKLQGKIPSSFSNLTSLAIFNVSFNEGLEGPIPHGAAFQSNMSFIDDPHLCGFPILDACPDPKERHEREDEEEKVEHTFVIWMRNWIAIPGFILGIVIGFVGTLWILHAKSSPLRAFLTMWHVSM